MRDDDQRLINPANDNDEETLSDLPQLLGSELSAFERIKLRDENGHEYWLARELAKLLGYSKWQHFYEHVLTEAIAVCEREGSDSVTTNFHRLDEGEEGHERIFTDTGKNSARGRKSVDYRLTRHACYIIAESADGRKEEVAWAKIYFAFTTERYELLAQSEEDRLRIEHRQKLLLHNTQLAMQAQLAGVITPTQYQAFFNAGLRMLYQGESAAMIRKRKGLKNYQDIADFMGSLETLMNDVRALLTIYHMQEQEPTTPTDATTIHKDTSAAVRAFFVSQGVYPEQLHTPEKSYQQLLREQAARERLAAQDRDGLWGALLTDRAGDDSERQN